MMLKTALMTPQPENEKSLNSICRSQDVVKRAVPNAVVRMREME